MTTPEQSANGSSPQLPSAADLVEESRSLFSVRPRGNTALDAVAASDVRSACPDEKVAESFSMHVHKYVTEIIRLADQKATFTFALCTSLLCYAFKSNLHRLWMKAPATYAITDSLCFIAMACLAGGLVLSAWVIVPNLRKSHRGFVFFGSIAEYESSSAYASEILGTPSTHLRRALLQHTYDISRVCTSKYWWLGRALWLTAIGVLLFVTVLLLKQ